MNLMISLIKFTQEIYQEWTIKFFGAHSFAQKLARHPSKLRYVTPKQLWMAMRLGLYHTVLSNNVIFNTSRSQIVRLIAALKRQELGKEQARAAIFEVLCKQKFTKYHRELIKEAFYLYPKVFVEYFEQNSEWLSDPDYIGLYLSYLAGQHKDCLDKRHILSLLEKLPSDINRVCLENNLQDGTDSISLNQMLAYCQLSPLSPSSDDHLMVNRLQADAPYQCSQVQKVTVLVTAFNAEQTITTCLNSLLNQTWQSLEVIAIDDASTDDTFKIIQDIARQDDRVIGIHLPKNVGTFVAKSIGARFATGEFLTCQDSDDFAHPQKIERQVLPLIDRPELIATTSHWLRLDEYGRFYARQYYPFLRQNPASPLFRREQVEREIGLWHLIRTGADSEFWHRLKLHYGDDCIMVVKEPLTIASHRADSLMNAGDFGVHDKASALRRLDYWEAWNLWHIECLSRGLPLYMPKLNHQIGKKLFKINERLLVSPDDIRYNLENLIIEKQND